MGVDDRERRAAVGTQFPVATHGAGPQPNRDAVGRPESRQLDSHKCRHHPVAGLDAPVDGVLGRIEDSGRNRGPLDRIDTGRNGRRRGPADVAARGERIVVPTGRSSQRVEGDPHLIGQVCALLNQLDDTRITLLDMGAQGSDMRPHHLGDIRIEGVVGEVVLRTRGEDRDLGVQQRSVQRRDPVALTRRPPTPEPMAKSQPAQ
jgi:hypothetical protein